MSNNSNFRPMWMIRAGAGANFIDRFLEQGHVAVGWNDLGDLPPGVPRTEIARRVAAQWPNYKKGKVYIVAGQIYRFLNEIAVGDRVVSYEPGRRVYPLVTVHSDAYFDESVDPLARIRGVSWGAEVPFSWCDLE